MIKNCKHISDHRYSYFSCPYITGNDKLPLLPLPPELKFSDYSPPEYDVKIITDRVTDGAGKPDGADEAVNEFIVKRHNSQNGEQGQEIQKVFAYLMALRRSTIFSHSATIRRHHVFLPPAVLTWKKDGDSKELYMVPYLTFHRNPDHYTVRRTFTYGVFYVPKGESWTIDDCLKLLQSGSASKGDHWHGDDIDASFHMDGDFKDYIGLDTLGHSLGDLEKRVLDKLLDRLVHKHANQKDRDWARINRFYG